MNTDNHARRYHGVSYPRYLLRTSWLALLADGFIIVVATLGLSLSPWYALGYPLAIALVAVVAVTAHGAWQSVQRLGDTIDQWDQLIARGEQMGKPPGEEDT